MIADLNIAQKDCTGSDQAVIPDNRRFSVNLPDGYVLIDPAFLSNDRKTGYEDPMQSVGKGGNPLKHGIRAHIPAVAVSAPAHQKGQDIPAKTCLSLLLQTIQLPEMMQIISPGIINHASSDTHVFSPCAGSPHSLIFRLPAVRF